MDEVLLMGLGVCTLGGFIIGAVVGVVLGHDIARARCERRTPDLTVEAIPARELDSMGRHETTWDEDLTDPEGEWKG